MVDIRLSQTSPKPPPSFRARRPPKENCHNHDCGTGRAARLLRITRSVTGVSTADLAASAGCAESLVTGIESGQFDPTLDTVNRLVNSVGLEVRAGPQPVGSGDQRLPGDGLADADEIGRVRQAFEAARDFRSRYGLAPLGPPPGSQPHWDGEDPAPGHRFRVAEAREDGGGWSALLVRDARDRMEMTQPQVAAAGGISETDIARIETGELRLSVVELEHILNSMGLELHTRLEPYDDHDDVLHLIAMKDPKLHQHRLQKSLEAIGRNHR